MTETLDKRLNVYRPDLADKRLENLVEAERFVEGKPMRVVTHFADLLAKPDENAGLDAQVLHGQDVDVFDAADGWCWIQQKADGYVGYVRQNTLAKCDETPTHMVKVPRTFLYSEPDLKRPRNGYRSMGSKLTVVASKSVRSTDYSILSSGDALITKHLIEIGDWQKDYVAVAETLLHTPYLWGGNTGFGLDCSGLISLSHMLCGKTVPRDSDMLAASLGTELEPDLNRLRRGDLVFWKGHVGIMADGKTLLHANGNTMNVALEPLAEAISRIGYLYGQPTGMRRP